MICTKTLGKQESSDINRSTFYLKEKCDNLLICEVFLFVVMREEVRKKCRLVKENVSDFENEEEHVPCEWLGNVEVEVIV